jgi:hypothetical protein
LHDLSQIFLYAGRMRQDAVADLALDEALRIAGTPEDSEKQLALVLSAADVRSRGARAQQLLRERSRHIRKIDGACGRLSNSIPELCAARNSLSFLLRLFFAGGSIVVLLILLLRRR